MPTTAPAAKAKTPAKRTAKPRTKTRKPAAKRADAVQRPIWIAVGAVAMATEAVQDFLGDALKRGEKLEARARKELKKRTNGAAKPAPQPKAKAKPKAKNKKATLDAGKIADRVLHALEIPTHGDLVSLEKKVDALSRKVA